MASAEYILAVQLNHRRAHAIIQETRGQLRRAPRNERPAIVDRAVARFTRECVRVVPRG